MSPKWIDNTGETNNSTGMFTGGEAPEVPLCGGDVLVALNGTGIELASGHVFGARIDYHGGELTIAISDAVTLASFSQLRSLA